MKNFFPLLMSLMTASESPKQKQPTSTNNRGGLHFALEGLLPPGEETGDSQVVIVQMEGIKVRNSQFRGLTGFQ